MNRRPQRQHGTDTDALDTKANAPKTNTSFLGCRINGCWPPATKKFWRCRSTDLLLLCHSRDSADVFIVDWSRTSAAIMRSRRSPHTTPSRTSTRFHTETTPQHAPMPHQRCFPPMIDVLKTIIVFKTSIIGGKYYNDDQRFEGGDQHSRGDPSSSGVIEGCYAVRSKKDVDLTPGVSVHLVPESTLLRVFIPESIRTFIRREHSLLFLARVLQ